MGIRINVSAKLITGCALVISLLYASECSAQSVKKDNYFDNPIVIDSASSVVIPVRYDASIFSSNKLAAWDNYYANLVLYNIQTDSSKHLFKNNTYIMDFRTPVYYGKIGMIYRQTAQSQVSKWILLRVKNIDYNKNGRMDQDDPDILYAADIHGNNLTCLSTQYESVVAIQVFEKQNFALIKFQRDQDGNRKYEHSDNAYFFRKLDLSSLTLGNKIEVR